MASFFSELRVSFSQFRVSKTVDTKDLDDGRGRKDAVNAVLNIVVVEDVEFGLERKMRGRLSSSIHVSTWLY